jgi:hypothetical protein
MYGSRRNLPAALACLLILGLGIAGPARAMQDTAQVSLGSSDKPRPPTPTPPPSPEPSPEPSPSSSPEPSPEPSPSSSPEPSPEPSPSSTPRPDAPPPPTAESTPQPGSGGDAGAPTGAATSGLSAGTTTQDLLAKLRDQFTDIATAPPGAKAGNADDQSRDIPVLGGEDAWIESISSMIVDLGSVGSEAPVATASCRTRACGPVAERIQPGLTLIVIAVLATFIGVVVARRRRGSDGWAVPDAK